MRPPAAMKSPSSKSWRRPGAAGALVVGAMAMSGAALALEFRSVDAPAAIFYDAPSLKGKKLFLVRRFTPVEIVVNLDGWAKVRDAEGTLAWIDKKALAERRTAVVTAPRAEVRQAAEGNAALVFEAEKGVALDIVDAPRDGWARVRHADGQSGFVRITQVWGF